MDAERCFNFNDFNLDFIDLTPPQQKTQPVGAQRTPCAVLKASELAKRIADCDALVAKVQQLEAEQTQLQQQLQDFRQTAKEIQTLYESEKQQRCALQQQLVELQLKYDKLNDELAHEGQQRDQLQAQCDALQAQCDAAKGPLEYCELALKYLKLAQKFEEPLHWTEKALVSDLRKHCEEQGHMLPPSQKSPKKRARAGVSKSVQCALLPQSPPATEDKSAQCDANLPKTTHCQSTQCERVETHTQGTQHISTTTTRSTSTACFIKKHNVGTSFPEPKLLPPLDDILAELRKWDDIAPLSPICELRTPTPPPPVTQLAAIERRTIGTCTFLCNVQRQIDFIPSLHYIKRSHSRSPTRLLYENVACKREAFITPSPSPPPVATTGSGAGNAQSPGTSGSVFASSFPQLAQLQPSVFTAFWQMVGQILLSLLHPTPVREGDHSSGNRPSTIPASVGLDMLKEQSLHNWMYSSCENIQQTLQRTREEHHSCGPSPLDPTTALDGLGSQPQINFVEADNLRGNLSRMTVSKDPLFCMPPSRESVATGPLHLLTPREQEAFCELDQEQETAYRQYSDLAKFNDIGRAQQMTFEKSLKRKHKNKHKHKRNRDRDQEREEVKNASNFVIYDGKQCDKPKDTADEMVKNICSSVNHVNSETATGSQQKQTYGSTSLVDAATAMPEIGSNEGLEQKESENCNTMDLAKETMVSTDKMFAMEGSAELASGKIHYTVLQQSLFGSISDTDDSEQSGAAQDVCDLDLNVKNKACDATKKIEQNVPTRIDELQEAELHIGMEIVKQSTIQNLIEFDSNTLKPTNDSAEGCRATPTSDQILDNQFRSPEKSLLSAAESMPQINEDIPGGGQEIGMAECPAKPANQESCEKADCEPKVAAVTNCMPQIAEDECSESNLVIDESDFDEANSPPDCMMDVLQTGSEISEVQSATTDHQKNVNGEDTTELHSVAPSTTDASSTIANESIISPLLSDSLLQNIMGNESTCEMVNTMLKAGEDDSLMRSNQQEGIIQPKRRGRKRKGDVLATPTICKRSERLRNKQQMQSQFNAINISAEKRPRNMKSSVRNVEIASVADCDNAALSIEVSCGKVLTEPTLSMVAMNETSTAKCDTPKLNKNLLKTDELQHSNASSSLLEKTHVETHFQCAQHCQNSQQKQRSNDTKSDAVHPVVQPPQTSETISSLSATLCGEIVHKLPLPATASKSESDIWPCSAPISYDAPASPPACVDPAPTAPTKEIPLELNPDCYPRKHNSLLECLVGLYSADQYKIVNAQQNTGTPEQRRSLLDQLQLFLSTTHSNLDMAAATLVRTLHTITSDNQLIVAAIVSEVKAVPRPEQELACPVDQVPAKYLTAQLRQITVALRHLHYADQGITSALLAKIESILFQYQNVDAVSLSEALNLTQLYLLAIPIQYSSAQANPARLFVAKCLYYYNVRASPMVYEVLCCYPTALPHREDRSYDRSDALITVIQHILMCTAYNMLSTDLRTKELLSMLRFQYHYQPFKPDAAEVLDNLLAKLKAGRLANLKYAFAIFCKRQPPAKVLAEVLHAQLMPLASEYYQQVLQTSDYDERAAALLDCISMVVKPLPIDTDISVYLSTFERFLSAVQRSTVQEAAMLAILRLQRFDYCSCFRALRNFTPAYALRPLTKNVLKTFIHRRPLKIWKQLTDTTRS